MFGSKRPVILQPQQHAVSAFAILAGNRGTCGGNHLVSIARKPFSIFSERATLKGAKKVSMYVPVKGRQLLVLLLKRRVILGRQTSGETKIDHFDCLLVKCKKEMKHCINPKSYMKSWFVQLEFAHSMSADTFSRLP